ncbi:MAG: Type IV-A pilus assembly ATPase PilB [Candidatus Beckwithbacteria bacterium GW2011_GWC2_47_9]|uniref:Type IV-A pilus assembly ATPase PilB n=1 Tax=Candidatus Beckwithbacteria bacterium GW2011_GWC2_47_9 TaxID=1618373 RepID=A0A0G1WCY8_9BACT|nr:MAG: Type IV-A pilus assembly ATPase PilB [Candidatus Beckwithbacteria bacterium GW2011_GWC2_47_9]
MEPVEALLLKHNLVSETEIAKAKAAILKVEYVDVATASVVPEAINVLPEAVAEKYLCLPFNLDKTNKVLSVAMADPADLPAIEFIEKKTGLKIKPYLAEASLLLKEISSRYSQSLSSEVTAALKETITAKPTFSQLDSLTAGGGVIREAPISKIVSTILEFAMKSRASDVHIEPLEVKTRVRYRIDGILYEKLVLPRSVHDSVISRIKILSHLKIDEKRIPQDGRFNFRAGEEEVDLRVSTMPSVYGEKVVMRLLKKAMKVPDLPELGLRGRALLNLQNSIRVPHGIILVTGPTGSGKTTTLYSILSKINTPKVNIMTLEDPVEYQMTGITQVQINPQAGLTFASGMRSFLRQDPDIIMVGEVRDIETAELAIQTNSAAGALPRLLDMEAEPFLLTSSMTCIVGQRVCRQICSFCKESYEPSPEVASDIKAVLGSLLHGSIKLFRGKKCLECNQTGYSGRVGIFEVLPVTEAIGKMILERSPSGAIEKIAKDAGMIDMKQDGYLKVLEGLTTLEEVLRVAET